MAAPGCVRHRGRAQRRSTCWCRTSPAPRSPSPPCTPSSGCQWAPDGNSVEKKYSRFVTTAFYFFRSIRLTIKGLTCLFVFLQITLNVALHNGYFLKCKAAEILLKFLFSFNRNWMIWKRSSPEQDKTRHKTSTFWNQHPKKQHLQDRNYDSTKINSLNVSVTFGVPWRMKCDAAALHISSGGSKSKHWTTGAQQQHHMFSRKSLPVKTTTSCTAGVGEHFHPEAQEFGIFAIPW